LKIYFNICQDIATKYKENFSIDIRFKKYTILVMFILKIKIGVKINGK